MYYGTAHVLLLRSRNYQRPNIREKKSKVPEDDGSVAPAPPAVTRPIVQAAGTVVAGDDDYVSVPDSGPR